MCVFEKEYEKGVLGSVFGIVGFNRLREGGFVELLIVVFVVVIRCIFVGFRGVVGFDIIVGFIDFI